MSELAEGFCGYFKVEVEVGGDVLEVALLDGVSYYYFERVCLGAGNLFVIKCEFKNLKIGKAGRKRYMGVRPTVRGVTMNPCDHPHGGGEGKTGPGGHPKTPWGKPALGYKTRKKNKASDKLIVRRRKK